MRIEFDISFYEEAAEQAVEKWTANEDVDGPCHNADQALWVEGDCDLLIYEGQRYPFLQDGAYSAIMETFGTREDAEDMLVSYETSDERLFWWETLADLVGRLSPSDFHTELVQLRVGDVDHVSPMLGEPGGSRVCGRVLQMSGRGSGLRRGDVLSLGLKRFEEYLGKTPLFRRVCTLPDESERTKKN